MQAGGAVLVPGAKPFAPADGVLHGDMEMKSSNRIQRG